MVRMKPLTLYPLLFLPRSDLFSGMELKEELNVQRVMENKFPINYRGNENLYSVIVDDYEKNFAFGRFSKLKKDNIERLQIQEKGDWKEELDVTEENEYIEANAYFVWDLDNNILLAEYNRDSLNVLSNSLEKVLGNAFRTRGIHGTDITLQPFPSEEFIQEIIVKKGHVYKYYLSLKELNKENLEYYGASSELIWEIASTGQLGISTTFRLGDKQSFTSTVYEKLKKIADKVRKDANKMIVYTDAGNFDLIGDKAIYYNTDVILKNEINAYRHEMYLSIKEKLTENTDLLLQILKKMEKKQTRLKLG